MTDSSKTNQELIEEIAVLKQRIMSLEQLELAHKKTEETLKENEEQYRLAFESTSDGIFTVDSNFNISSITPSVERQLGYKVEEIINRPIQDLNILTSESLTRAVSDVIQVLSGAEVIGAVYEFISKDGTRKIGEVTGTPIIREGRIVRVAAIVRDITERKRTAEALVESESRLRALFDSAGYSISVAKKGVQTDFNPAFLKLFGYKDTSELLGANLIDLIAPEERERIRKYIDDRALGIEVPTHYETKGLRRDGSIFDMEVLISTYVIGNEIYTIGFQSDVTERKRAEKALQASKEQYRFVVENLKEVVFRTDAEGHWTFLNSAWAEVTGFAVKESLGRVFLEYVYPEDRQRNLELFRPLIERKKDYCRHEIRYIHKDESFRWIEVWARLTLDEKGRATGTAGTLTDITERKQAEEALKESKAQLSNALEIAHLGHWEYDVASDLFTFNDQFYKIFHTDVEKVGGYTMHSAEYSHRFVHPDDMNMVGEETRKAVETTDPSFNRQIEHRMLYADGTVGYIAVRFFIVKDSHGRTVKTYGVNQDITDRKRAEEEKQRSLAEAERMAGEMAVIAEIGRVIGSTLDIDEVYERLAAETKKLILFDRLVVNLHSLHGENIKVAYVSGEDFPGRCRGDSFPMKGSICEVLTKTRAGLLNFPGNVVDINSHIRNHHAPAHTGMSSLLRVPLIYRDEVIGSLHFGSRTPNAYTEKDLQLAEKIGAQIAGALGSARLFSEHKQAEAERRNLQERLQRAEKMEALGQLAGGVAHDLNNVLGILSGYSELLLEELPEGSRSRGHAEKILKSTEKGAAIIQDLLTLARRGVTTSDVINLHHIVSEFLKTPVFEKLKDNHPNVTFRAERDCDQSLLNIKGSPVHLEKTLMNLTSNAAESISGKGEVTIRTESRYLDKPLQGYDEVKEGDYAVLTVSDTGIGIPADNIEKIFEPFYTKKTMGRSGTGLGLAIVWGTVKDHSGYIDVQTKVGEGTTFTLYFPVTSDEMQTQQPKTPIEQYMGKGESVLVADDIAEQRDVASGLLTRLGYQVHDVSSGERAVEYLKANKADILVLDMIMAPGIDGLETYRKVLEINPRQKAILVSGFSETERVKDAQKLGAGAYVKKPYTLEKIGMAIRDELERK